MERQCEKQRMWDTAKLGCLVKHSLAIWIFGHGSSSKGGRVIPPTSVSAVQAAGSEGLEAAPGCPSHRRWDCGFLPTYILGQRQRWPERLADWRIRLVIIIKTGTNWHILLLSFSFFIRCLSFLSSGGGRVSVLSQALCSAPQRTRLEFTARSQEVLI